MKNKKLILIDIDGTLKNNEDIITDETKKSINKAIKKGYEIVLCSARPRYYTSKVGLEIGANNYYISSNGSEIFDNIQNKVIYSEFIDNDTVKKVYDACNKFDVRCVFTTDDMEYTTKFVRNESQVLLTNENFDLLFNSNIKQIMIIDKNNMKDIEDYLVNKYEIKIADRTSKKKEETWFSIINKNCNKGKALKILTDYLKCDYTIAIGNDNNDIGMIKMADLGVCVDNSTDEIKEIADLIIDSNDNDGVSKFLNDLE